MKKIFEKISHTIIPHEKNGNIPHILKEEFVFVIAIFVGLLFYFNQNNLNIIRDLNLTATVYPAVLADLTNQDRNNSGVSRLTWNTTLENAAKLKAEDMLKNSYFAHTSPSGVTPWHWLKVANYNFIYAGENLAVDFTESDNIQKAWLNSPKHRENILNSNFTEIGIATADGFFEGKNTTFVVEFFGKPSRERVVEKKIENKKIFQNEINEKASPQVAGAMVENIIERKDDLALEVVKENKQFIVVKNENVSEEEILKTDQKEENKNLSTWYYRFIVSPTNTIRIIYLSLLSLLLVAVLLVLSREYQKHQIKHLFLGIFLIVIITILLYIISTNNTQILLGFNK